MFLFLRVVILTFNTSNTFSTSAFIYFASVAWNFLFSPSCLCLVSHLDKLINLLAAPAHISPELTGTPDQIIRFHKLQKIILLPCTPLCIAPCSLQTNFTLECLKTPKISPTDVWQRHFSCLAVG